MNEFYATISTVINVSGLVLFRNHGQKSKLLWLEIKFFQLCTVNTIIQKISNGCYCNNFLYKKVICKYSLHSYQKCLHVLYFGGFLVGILGFVEIVGASF